MVWSKALDNGGFTMKTVKLTDEAYNIILDMLRHNYTETQIERESAERLFEIEYPEGPLSEEYEDIPGFYLVTPRGHAKKHVDELAQQEKEALRLYREFQGK